MMTAAPVRPGSGLKFERSDAEAAREVERHTTSPSFTWICRNSEERGRLVAMHRLLVPANKRIAVVGAVLLALCAPTTPPLALSLLVASFGVVAIIGQSLDRWRRPELALAASVGVVELLISGASVAAHIQTRGGLILLLWPLVGFNARYPRRVALAGTAFTTLLIALTEVLTAWPTVRHDPLVLTIPLAAVVAVAAVTSAARNSDIEHMRRAVLDPLTGLLNRSALSGRVNELAQQSAGAGVGVAVLLGDIDHFKAVNDTHGHQAGDDVLRTLGERLREELRAFDLLYRIGGEEFVVLAPGASLAEGRGLAERLRGAVAGEAVAGLPVTMSWGVAVSDPERPFEWEPLYRAADAALYEAKSSGRDRVCSAAGAPREVAA
jgi:diguanylate cyclase (GGDEF)-like protein